MKVVRYKHSDVVSHGELDGDRVRQWSDAPWNGGRRLADAVTLEEVELLAPCVPGKVIATAINYPGATGLTDKTHEPLVFLKPASAVIGPGHPITSPFDDVGAWGECELGIVIGKRLHRAGKEEAMAGIFGYTIGNDVSAENILDWDHHLARSKGADTFCPLGPWIDTEYDPADNWIRGYYNGDLIREGRLDQRLWKEPELIVWLSTWMTLEPGDVILTGAPTRTRPRQYFSDGDVFKCVIDGFGELTNPYRALHA